MIAFKRERTHSGNSWNFGVENKMKTILSILTAALLAGCAVMSQPNRDDSDGKPETEFNIDEFMFFADGVEEDAGKIINPPKYDPDSELPRVPTILQALFFPEGEYVGDAQPQSENDGCPVSGAKEAKIAYLETFEDGNLPERFGAITSFNVHRVAGTRNAYEGEIEICSWHRKAEDAEDAFYLRLLFGKHKMGEQNITVEYPYLMLVKKVPNDESFGTDGFSKDPFPGTLNPAGEVEWDNLVKMINEANNNKGWVYKLHAKGHAHMPSMIVEATVNGKPRKADDEDKEDDTAKNNKREDCFDLFFDHRFMKKYSRRTKGWSSPPEHGATCLGRCDARMIATAG